MSHFVRFLTNVASALPEHPGAQPSHADATKLIKQLQGTLPALQQAARVLQTVVWPLAGPAATAEAEAEAISSRPPNDRAQTIHLRFELLDRLCNLAQGLLLRTLCASNLSLAARRSAAATASMLSAFHSSRLLPALCKAYLLAPAPPLRGPGGGVDAGAMQLGQALGFLDLAVKLLVCHHTSCAASARPAAERLLSEPEVLLLLREAAAARPAAAAEGDTSYYHGLLDFPSLYVLVACALRPTSLPDPQAVAWVLRGAQSRLRSGAAWGQGHAGEWGVEMTEVEKLAEVTCDWSQGVSGLLRCLGIIDLEERGGLAQHAAVPRLSREAMGLTPAVLELACAGVVDAVGMLGRWAADFSAAGDWLQDEGAEVLREASYAITVSLARSLSCLGSAATCIVNICARVELSCQIDPLFLLQARLTEHAGRPLPVVEHPLRREACQRLAGVGLLRCLDAALRGVLWAGQQPGVRLAATAEHVCVWVSGALGQECPLFLEGILKQALGSAQPAEVGLGVEPVAAPAEAAGLPQTPEGQAEAVLQWLQHAELGREALLSEKILDVHAYLDSMRTNLRDRGAEVQPEFLSLKLGLRQPELPAGTGLPPPLPAAPWSGVRDLGLWVTAAKLMRREVWAAEAREAGGAAPEGALPLTSVHSILRSGLGPGGLPSALCGCLGVPTADGGGSAGGSSVVGTDGGDGGSSTAQGSEAPAELLEAMVMVARWGLPCLARSLEARAAALAAYGNSVQSRCEAPQELCVAVEALKAAVAHLPAAELLAAQPGRLLTAAAQLLRAVSQCSAISPPAEHLQDKQLALGFLPGAKQPFGSGICVWGPRGTGDHSSHLPFLAPTLALAAAAVIAAAADVAAAEPALEPAALALLQPGPSGWAEAVAFCPVAAEALQHLASSAQADGGGAGPGAALAAARAAADDVGRRLAGPGPWEAMQALRRRLAAVVARALPPGRPLYPPAVLKLCANPGCGDFAAEHEGKLKLRRCGGCGVEQYCGRACQQEAWRAGHKHTCAGRAAGASGGQQG
ncbi:hypothetical protein HYH03_005258 [Edaphochlamys debaryana]|uniref:MYND-type domain-containing protein n=1 Tax=Edaphochlamys debaryana TaxID=47281 RepID=A0A836C1K8_9CHLO|nr:hypothetical protein HYH03_005258 [Edaphochlamys debaryana]|eukprot:KAG2496855.1 hypothetical protein HYH03_005258 [Edaphochlamys debaryana]